MVKRKKYVFSFFRFVSCSKRSTSAVELCGEFAPVLLKSGSLSFDPKAGRALPVPRAESCVAAQKILDFVEIKTRAHSNASTKSYSAWNAKFHEWTA
jgi:hypothetical protein